jgi:DNA helicase-2/ATP-dependent DNA helicase PcrA
MFVKLKPIGGNALLRTAICLIISFIGNMMMHERFGRGQVVNLEGVGADKKGRD